MYDGLSGQKKGILFLTAVVIVFMQGGLWSARRQSVDNFPDNSLLPVKTYLPFTKSNARPTVKEHPIPKLMAEAEALVADSDFEGAFVEYAKAATIVHEKLPTHREYQTLLNADQRHNLGMVSPY